MNKMNRRVSISLQTVQLAGAGSRHPQNKIEPILKALTIKIIENHHWPAKNYTNMHHLCDCFFLILVYFPLCRVQSTCFIVCLLLLLPFVLICPILILFIRAHMHCASECMR